MDHFWLIARIKRKLFANYAAGLKRHILFHFAVFGIVLSVLMGGGYFFFRLVFDYLMRLEVIGPLLMNQVVSMVLMTFFTMLVFSNLIVTLSTAYISQEVEFYMGLPVKRPAVFFVRFGESVMFSSWAFGALSLPLLTAYGASRDCPPIFYAMTLALALPFLFIPAGLGALLTMGLAAVFPARRTFRMAIVIGAVGVVIVVALMRLMNLRTAMSTGELESFRQIMGVLEWSAAPALPSSWLMQGMVAAETGAWRSFLYWFAMLASTAMVLVQLCSWLVPWCYYRGWLLATQSAANRSAGGAAKSPFIRIDRWLGRLGPQLGAIVSKDLKTFWRDPAQWTQLIILFGLLFVYVANLKSIARYNRSFELQTPFWQTVVSFFNLGAGCFVLSILTTRFVYPMLSLEGRQFWTIGLAPIKRETLVWEKYWLCWASSLLLTASLMLFSNMVLHVNLGMLLLSLGTVTVVSFALTSISVGLGALTPNFKEDNPARIANGLGGTLNVIFSLTYVGLVIAVEVWPAYLISSGRIREIESPVQLLSLFAFILASISAIAIYFPMSMGLKHWRELEF